MSSSLITPAEKTILDSKNHLESELQAFLEAFHLLEAGALPAEILKKIA
jgi:hypothetical protein